ncbi:MAG TPA: NAD-dependent epimerase/dehydratase family protein [Solirubrobacteraceae bacterium]
MTVLVTGAAGFLGSHVVDLLIDQGAKPRALVRPGDDARRLVAADADVRYADLADPDTLAAVLEGVDRVLHCAARTGPWGPEHEYERTNVVGLERLVRAAVAEGVRRIVHVSSITVHGNDVRGEADETSPVRDERNPYSRSKVAGERLLQRLVRELGAPVTIVRPGWIYGPRDAASFARLARMIECRRMFLIGAGDNHLPLIHVRDVARGVLAASEAATEPGRAYVLVNDEPVTQRQFLAAIAAELNVPAPSRRVPYGIALTVGALSETVGRRTHRRQPPPLMRYGLQLLGGENRFVIRRARRELGFKPAVGLADGVPDSLQWYRDRATVATPSEVTA